jgi:hypothetical protein
VAALVVLALPGAGLLWPLVLVDGLLLATALVDAW